MTEPIQDRLELSLRSDSKALRCLPALPTCSTPRRLLGGLVEIQAERRAYKLGDGLVLFACELLHLLLKRGRQRDGYRFSVRHGGHRVYEIVTQHNVSVLANIL